jgi:hypothetical protein
VRRLLRAAMAPDMRSLSTMLLRWRSENVDPLPPEKPDAIREAFASIGLLATSDVIALYGAIGGMRMMDGEYWRLWPLAEVRTQEPSSYGAVFSDYCLSCWEYRLMPVSADVSAIYVDRCDGAAPMLVAPSLESFFERYVADARSLLDAA